MILDSYVSDEIITARSGVRVRVGNTDAEGRMIMGDVLCQMKERVSNAAVLESAVISLVPAPWCWPEFLCCAMFQDSHLSFGWCFSLSDRQLMKSRPISSLWLH